VKEKCVYERKGGEKKERNTTEVGWGRWVKDQVQQQASCAAKQQERGA
jgi:hypothetical protein